MKRYLGQHLANSARLPIPQTPTDQPARPCAICGLETAQWIPNERVIKLTTAQIADTFRTPQTCVWCAACFDEPRLLAGGIIAMSGGFIKPLAQGDGTGRPAWRDVLRVLDDNTPTVAILTTNTKRRLWTKARVSPFSNRWQPLFVEGDTDRLLNVHAQEIPRVLGLVEQVYALGFSKQAILTSLLSSMRVCMQIGMAEAVRLDTLLKGWRIKSYDTLLVAVFAAQKEALK